MKPISTMMLACLLAASVAFGADEAKKGKAKKRGEARQRDGKAGGHDRMQRLREMLGQLDLTEEQQKEVQQILEAFGEDVKRVHEANKEKIEAIKAKMAEAREAGDRKAMMAAGKEMRQLHKDNEVPDIREKIAGVLNAEQKAKFQALGKGEGRGSHGPGVFEKLNLDEDQKKQIHEIMSAFREEMKGWHEDNKDKIQLIRTAMGEARKNKDRDAMTAAMEQAKALRDSAPNRDGLKNKIMAVLNDEQKAIFEKENPFSRDASRQRRGPDSGGGESPASRRPKRQRPTAD